MGWAPSLAGASDQVSALSIHHSGAEKAITYIIFDLMGPAHVTTTLASHPWQIREIVSSHTPLLT